MSDSKTDKPTAKPADTVSVTLKKPHMHKRVAKAKGAAIKVSKSQAAWLEQRGIV